MAKYSDSTRVGIVTLDSRFNYGNRLQAYAVQNILKSLGYLPTTLRPIELSASQRFKRIAKRMLRKPVSIEAGLSPSRRQAFNKFDELISSKDLMSDYDIDLEFDIFIAGSDQIWNPRFMAYRHPEFLPFASSYKRIALAASIGLSDVPRLERDWLARGINGFESISVREHSAVEIVRNLTGRDAELIIDPTLVLSVSDWQSVSDDRLTPTEPYIFTYLLGGVNNDAQEVLTHLTHGQTKIISLTDREAGLEVPAGPSEFISLIANAKHVVTDSFHASVFSLLMGTPLTIVRRHAAQSSYDMFSRLESFVTILGLEHVVYGAPEYDYIRSQDYNHSLELLEIERVKFLNFLNQSLIMANRKRKAQLKYNTFNGKL